MKCRFVSVAEFAAWDAAVEAVLSDAERDGVAQCFDDYDDLVGHDLRTRGFTTARRVA